MDIIKNKLLALLKFPLGSINTDGCYNFCDICGELYPLHHSGVKHENATKLKKYVDTAQNNSEQVVQFIIDNKDILQSIKNATIEVHQSWVDAGFIFTSK